MERKKNLKTQSTQKGVQLIQADEAPELKYEFGSCGDAKRDCLTLFVVLPEENKRVMARTVLRAALPEMKRVYKKEHMSDMEFMSELAFPAKVPMRWEVEETYFV